MTDQANNLRRDPLRTAPRRRLSDNLRSGLVTGLICAGLLTTMYGVTLHRAEERAAQEQAQKQRDTGAPERSPQRPMS